MNGRFFFFGLLIATFILAQGNVVRAADPSLIGHWLLNEGSGDVAKDLSPGGIDAAIVGPTWETDAEHGTVLVFNGIDDYVEIPGPYELETYTVSVWFRFDGTPGGTFDVASIYAVSAHLHGILLELRSDGTMRYLHRAQPMGTGGGTTAYTTDTYDDGAWYHMAAVKTADTMILYMNGEVALTASDSTVFEEPLTVILGWLGGTTTGTSGRWFEGAMSDFRIYNRALAENEIPSTMVYNPTSAASPILASGGTDVLRDVTLTWTPGESAVKHNVYFGTSFDDVNTAAVNVLVSEAQDANAYAPGVLAFGQTYYWRVDEVNGPPDITVFAGDVWSFTVEPFSIPVEMITATASSSNANMGPENTITGVGLNALDQHSTEPTEMWLSGMGDPAPWIQYEFDKPYKLHEMWVWNSNQLVESFVGLGAKDVVVEYSLDGTEWAVLAGATQFAQAPGSPTYTANTQVDFGGALARYVRITLNAGWGILPQYGLSAVRFLYIPTFPREPMPAVGDTTEEAVVELGWRAGREAASHQIYLGTDPNDLGLVATVSGSTYTATTLDYATTYYWQIVEVNEAETPSSFTGEVWRFATPAHYVVDDFEGYNDDCERIFFAWQDGIGHNGSEDCGVSPYNGNGTGSIVGNSLAPFAEQTIVHAGNQSMPLAYDSGMSETTLSLPGQDWAGHGIKSLSLFIHGTPDNTGQLYLKIDNTKVAYNGDAGDIRRPQWQAWIIDLSTVGGNLQNVTSLSLGIENASAPGMLYVDDIALYPLEREMITPTEPDTAGLAALYEFEGNADDSFGGNPGTAVGDPIYAAGAMGQAISLDGFDDYVQIANNSDLQLRTTGTYTVSAYVNLATLNHQMLVYHGLGCSTWASWYLSVGGSENGEADGMFAFGVRASNGGANTQITTTAIADTWVQLTATYDGSVLKLYVDGTEAASVATSTVPFDSAEDLYIGADPGCDGRTFCTGLIDDVALYTRALSAAEVLGLAGKTTPVVKPF